jgi:YcaO-like protein with predicted kinase domain
MNPTRARFELSSEPLVKHHRSGTHRIIDPGETAKLAWKHAPTFGITRVANVTGLDTIGIPVIMVCRPNSRSVSVSQGKGLTLDAARASGLMESIELYHAETIDLPTRYASYDDLRSRYRCADVATLPRLTSTIFSTSQPLLWVEGFDLMCQESTWVPYELVHADYRLPQPPGSGSFLMSSNGLASGNHVLEAASHAICELVERDAEALWTARRSDTRIDPTTIDDPQSRHILSLFEAAGVTATIHDMTSDIGIPAFRCVLSDPNRRSIKSNAGQGCHLDKNVALVRALTEAAQSRLTYIAGSRDDIRPSEYDDYFAESRAQAEARSLAGGRGIDFSSIRNLAADTIDGDIERQLSMLRSAGISSLVMVNLSKPEFPFAVVRVIVPGLECAVGAGDVIRGGRYERVSKKARP